MHTKYDYILFDLNSIFYRSKHVIKDNMDIETKVSFSLHITFKIIERLVKNLSNDKTKLVFCLDGKSWRYKIYEKYKIERKLQKAKKTKKEKEEDEKYNEVFRDFVDFIDKKTNTIVLWKDMLEADDLISVFCSLMKDENKILIVSNDNDFVQLIEDNVHLYLCHKDVVIRKDTAITFEGKPIYINVTNTGKIKIDKNALPNKLPDNWTEWALFLKICRGDSSDCIFPVLPRARVSLLEKVFQDKDNKGFKWNNFLLTTWTDASGNEHRVLEKYKENKMLVDLKDLPEEIFNLAKNEIYEKINKPKINNVGINFLKFCGKYKLIEISNNEKFWATTLSS